MKNTKRFYFMKFHSTWKRVWKVHGDSFSRLRDVFHQHALRSDQYNHLSTWAWRSYSETCIKRTPTIKRTRTPKKYLKWSFLLLPTCIKRTPPNMPDTGNAKDCHPQIFQFLQRDLTNLFDYFHSTVLYSISFCVYRACFTHPSSNLSCNLCLWYFDQPVHLNKEINANVYRHSL